jgi:hypothetical protein
MAQQVGVQIYGIDNNAFPQASGLPFSFPAQGFIARPVPQATTMNGVTMVSVIQVLPTGLNQPAHQYYTPTAVSAIITAANA